jgi:hypothetical protein
MCERTLTADGTRWLQPSAVRFHLAQFLEVDPSIIIIFIFFFKKGRTSFGNYRPIAIIKKLSEVFKFIIRDSLSRFLKSKLNNSQHGFIKSESSVTNKVTFLDFVALLGCLQGQTDYPF